LSSPLIDSSCGTGYETLHSLQETGAGGPVDRDAQAATYAADGGRFLRVCIKKTKLASRIRVGDTLGNREAV